MTSPILYGVMALGGYLLYENVKGADSNANQPDPNQRMPFWQGWMNQGSQPATGNGAPTNDVTSVSNAISDLAKFGTSLANYFGTAQSSGGGGGDGVSANSNQTASYSDGYNVGGSGFAGMDTSAWS